MGRDSMGVKGIDLREGDFVIGMDIIEDEEEQQVLTVSANGYGKRTKVAEWRAQNRGGKGIIGMDTSERNGALVKLRLVSPEDQLMVITNGGQVIRTRVSEIRETGRNTQGVRVIRLREGEQVVDVEPVAETATTKKRSKAPESERRGRSRELVRARPEMCIPGRTTVILSRQIWGAFLGVGESE